VYEIAIEALLQSHTEALTEKKRVALSAALKKRRSEKDPRRQAWTLRRALDGAVESLARN
jgi:hypothetical protein